MYRVTYDSPTPPTDLPEGAKVEQLPREFPVKINTHLEREFKIGKNRYTGDLYLDVVESDSNSSIYSRLNTDVARELAHAILEGIGDPVPGSAPTPKHVIDGDGDHWRLHDNGMYILTGLSDRSIAYYEEGQETLDEISRGYHGYTVVS
jgi:hypothetical protein